MIIPNAIPVAALKEAQKRGWTEVSLKDDWKGIFAAHDRAGVRV